MLPDKVNEVSREKGFYATETSLPVTHEALVKAQQSDKTLTKCAVESNDVEEKTRHSLFFDRCVLMCKCVQNPGGTPVKH